MSQEQLTEFVALEDFEKFRSSFKQVKGAVLIILSHCEQCRKDDNHLLDHIRRAFPQLKAKAPESIRRSRQYIQNYLGLFVDEETQALRKGKLEERWRQTILECKFEDSVR